MKVIFRNEMLILVPVEPEESSALTRWKADHRGHSFILATDQGSGLMLRDLGDPRLNQPINVTSRHPSKRIQLIGNFADTPFELDGQRYCSVESFWQSLKCRCENWPHANFQTRNHFSIAAQRSLWGLSLTGTSCNVHAEQSLNKILGHLRHLSARSRIHWYIG